MNNPPTGIVTFLFTDIEGSTQLWEQHPDAMRYALARHDEILRSAIEAHNGYVFKTIGDAFCAAFPTASDALNAVMTAQRAMYSQDWREISSLKIRAGLNTGTAEERDGDYFGQSLNRVARLMAAGHGGQVLLSRSTYERIVERLPDGVELKDMGERRLRDLILPEHIYQALAVDLPREFPPLKTLDYRPNNLPAQATSLIGREKELDALGTLIRRPDVRLVTLTGPGGIGKTLLALQLAERLLDEFADGVWFVDLAPISAPHLVTAAIAQALGIKESGGREFDDVLKAHLKEKHLLLILDNFEHLLLDVPKVSQLLAATHDIKIIATSRAVLHVYGEREFHVQPLALPPLGEANQTRPLDFAVLAQYEAVRLFVERASAVSTEFKATPDNIMPIVEICRRLDGLPLAIELAAARTRILSPRTLLERLSTSLEFLKGRPRDLPLRQGTLRNTVDWSYNLLDEDEKALFCRLSVFAGGCTLDAAETMASGGDVLPTLDVQALDLISSLADKSLLWVNIDTVGTQEESEPRIIILQTIREYAVERLKVRGEAGQARGLHLAYYAKFAERAEVYLRRSEQQAWLELLDRENDNLRVALTWSKVNDPDVFVRFVGALYGFWNARGYLSEGQRWLDAALKLCKRASLPVQFKVRHGAALMATDRGDYDRATALLRDNIDYFRGSGDLGWLAHELNLLGVVASHKGDYDQASSLLKEGLDLRYMLGSTADVAGSLNNLAHLSTLRNDYEQASALLSESLKIVRSRGDTRVESIVLNNLGYLAHRQGNVEEATDLYQQSLAIKQQLGDKAGMASSLSKLAEIAYSQGQSHQARSLYLQSLMLCAEAGDLQSTLAPLVGLADLDRAGGNLSNAARLLAFTSTLLETTGATLDPTAQVTYTRSQEQVRARLPEATLKAASDQGKMLTLQSLVVELNRHPQ